jgi:hypothetical protein
VCLCVCVCVCLCVSGLRATCVVVVVVVACVCDEKVRRLVALIAFRDDFFQRWLLPPHQAPFLSPTLRLPLQTSESRNPPPLPPFYFLNPLEPIQGAGLGAEGGPPPRIDPRAEREREQAPSQHTTQLTRPLPPHRPPQQAEKEVPDFQSPSLRKQNGARCSLGRGQQEGGAFSFLCPPPRCSLIATTRALLSVCSVAARGRMTEASVPSIGRARVDERREARDAQHTQPARRAPRAARRRSPPSVRRSRPLPPPPPPPSPTQHRTTKSTRRRRARRTSTRASPSS